MHEIHKHTKPSQFFRHFNTFKRICIVSHQIKFALVDLCNPYYICDVIKGFLTYSAEMKLRKNVSKIIKSSNKVPSKRYPLSILLSNNDEVIS